MIQIKQPDPGVLEKINDVSIISTILRAVIVILLQ